jgi:hypothetical protein
MEDELQKQKEDNLQKRKKENDLNKKIFKKIKNNLTKRNGKRPQKKLEENEDDIKKNFSRFLFN